MTTMNEIVERIKIKCNLIKDKEVAQELNISDGALSQYKIRNSVPYKTIIDFANKKGISLNYILTGNSESINSNCVQLRYFSNVYASAGFGAINGIEDYKNIYIDSALAVELFNLPKICNNIDIIKIYGDSMEPFVHSGELVVVERNKNDLNNIKNGEIVIINIGGEIYCKKILKNPIAQEIILSSISPHYPEFKIKQEDFNKTNIIGVVCKVVTIRDFESIFIKVNEAH
ncbi:helix-turn-helix domain-containing protein [Helicobacter sp. faydin-H20]|uniref:LexA family transcriptional regulator n=1 Tax=Helicobacter anatolicus TaxID=2905874 RepID=UPI001E362829|nr:S24 family peptidase [Helicobacter anatolicus]MCE3037479.1 helix-turn-helix domain-containing protein [Helicobacter anatolicus]